MRGSDGKVKNDIIKGKSDLINCRVVKFLKH